MGGVTMRAETSDSLITYLGDTSNGTSSELVDEGQRLFGHVVGCVGCALSDGEGIWRNGRFEGKGNGR